jgi:SAM-dependent methyltransferase
MSQTVPILGHMAAVSDPVRCRALLIVEQHELTVSEMCAVLQMPQSSVSRHLKTLGDDGWVASRRDGTSRYYSLAVDDLDLPARQLWALVRDQYASTTAAEEDRRRLGGVLARRRATSRAFFAGAAGEWDHLREGLFGESFHLWAVLGLVDPDMVVGDLGCGTGTLAQAIAPFVRQVIAVDASLDMLEAAQRRLEPTLPVELRQGEIEALPIDDDTLDAAVLSLVLHHVPDPVRALAEVARVVKSGGRVLVVDMLPHDREEYQQHMGHVWLGFSEAQITRVLKGAGFDRVRVRPLPVDPDAKGPSLFAAVATRV